MLMFNLILSFAYDFLQISKYFSRMKTKHAFLCEKLRLIPQTPNLIEAEKKN
jgi:hypothetical protein